MSNFEINTFRQFFPYFNDETQPVYLDSAATALKPVALIEATTQFYQSSGSVHRSQYDQAQTLCYEQARQRVQKLINAESENAIIWTSGTTQAINTVAYGLLPQFQAGDEIIISEADHHANFVTWFEMAQKCGAKLRILPMQNNWLIDHKALIETLNTKTKLVALNFVSNVTGTMQPIKQLIELIKEHSNALILVDAAQAISHIQIDLQQLNADFLAFSAHKLYGPTGLGVLAGKVTALEQLQPVQFGGKMIESVSKNKITFANLPYRLEAGTPNIAAVIGFNAVLKWLENINLQQAEHHCLTLADQVRSKLAQYENCQLFNAPHLSSIVSFVFTDINSSDLATLLTEQHIALRVGEHCAQPYLARLGQTSTLRLSFAPYNTQQDVDLFFAALDKSLQLLSE